LWVYRSLIELFQIEIRVQSTYNRKPNEACEFDCRHINRIANVNSIYVIDIAFWQLSRIKILIHIFFDNWFSLQSLYCRKFFLTFICIYRVLPGIFPKWYSFSNDCPDG
jgi:hypothetical protein